MGYLKKNSISLKYCEIKYSEKCRYAIKTKTGNVWSVSGCCKFIMLLEIFTQQDKAQQSK